jgi:hypothetical protein
MLAVSVTADSEHAVHTFELAQTARLCRCCHASGMTAPAALPWMPALMP